MTEIDKLKHYVSHTLNFIEKDLNEMKQLNMTASFPYLFLTFAGIDFLGGLHHGFDRRNSRKRSTWLISFWMSRTSDRYQKSNPDDSKSQALYLYRFARSGLVHLACVQQSVEVSTAVHFETSHLGYSQSNGASRVFIHPILFAEEFRKAAQLFLEDLYSKPEQVTTALSHIENYIDENSREEKEFPLSTLFQNLDEGKPMIAQSPATSSAQHISNGTTGPVKFE